MIGYGIVRNPNTIRRNYIDGAIRSAGYPMLIPKKQLCSHNLSYPLKLPTSALTPGDLELRCQP